MVLTETKNFNVLNIGEISKNKESLNAIYNVNIVITNSKYGARGGTFQKIDIIGTTKNIKLVLQKLQDIVEMAEYERANCKLRKRDRARTIHNVKRSLNINNLPNNSPRKYRNPYEILNELDDTPTRNLDIDVFPKLTNLCWADMGYDSE
jgi:hypothetical protein